MKQLDDRQSERSVHSFAKRTIKYFNLSKFFDVTEYQTQSLITVIYTCLDWQFQHHKMLQVNQYGALQNLQNLSNIIVFQNYETFNNLAHGEFMEWYKNLGYNKNFVSKAITIANELSNFPTLGNIGTEALYLIATLFGAKKSLFETLNTVKTWYNTLISKQKSVPIRYASSLPAELIKICGLLRFF